MFDPQYDYAEEYAVESDHGIGIVGAGGIVRTCHLPAYEKAGFDVVGLYDRDADRAREVAAEFGVAAFESLEALLADASVDVVDIAVPPSAQLDIARRAIETGHHVLCQKPLSDDFDDARTIARLVENHDVRGAVNQQMRWEKSIRAVRELLDDGTLGRPVRAKIDVSIHTEWNEAWHSLPRLEVRQHSIHYLDAMRALLGEPAGVYSSMARYPSQVPAGETRTVHLLEYPDDLRATIDASHHNWADPSATFRFEGTEGVVKGSFGLLENYPEPGVDEFHLGTRDDAWDSYRIPNAWFPDAFIPPMAELLRCIEEGETHPTAPADNLRTLQLVNAAYLSTRERRAVDPADVDRDYEPAFDRE